MYRALLVTEPPLQADELRSDLDDAGIDVVVENDDATALAQSAVRHAADLVVAASVSPSPMMFDAACSLGMLAPCPFVLFTSDGSAAQIERASRSGIHAYVVDGYARHRLLSIIQVARARFRHEQLLKEELVGLSRQFEERKLVDRAKGVLMRSRGIAEDEAFELLRGLAMRARQRIGIVAQGVIDMSRAGEAVNRAGQLRMLSQRLVLHYAQALCSFDATRTVQIIDDCVQRVEANLGILNKAIGADGYGALVDRVAASWAEVRTLCTGPAEAGGLADLDARAEIMLGDAEALTRFLESSGLAASLHVLNVAGRQRMLGQRIGKLCFMLALDGSPSSLEQLGTLTASAEAAHRHLLGLPLSSPAIRDNLQVAGREWQRLHAALETISRPEALVDAADACERLLEASERLTDQYEQAMQMLIGDRLGRIR